jgi:predicted nucleotidyltransferase
MAEARVRLVGQLRETIGGWRVPAAHASLFGSAARGDDREESDLDLLVDFAPGTDLFDMVHIKAELEEVFGATVDLIPRDGLKERVRSAATEDLVPL